MRSRYLNENGKITCVESLPGALGSQKAVEPGLERLEVVPSFQESVKPRSVRKLDL